MLYYIKVAEYCWKHAEAEKQQQQEQNDGEMMKFDIEKLQVLSEKIGAFFFIPFKDVTIVTIIAISSLERKKN